MKRFLALDLVFILGIFPFYLIYSYLLFWLSVDGCRLSDLLIQQRKPSTFLGAVPAFRFNLLLASLYKRICTAIGARGISFTINIRQLSTVNCNRPARLLAPSLKMSTGHFLYARPYFFFFGAINIIILFPSKTGIASTLPYSSRSVASLNNKICPWSL